MWLEDTSNRIKHIIAPTDATPAAMAKCHKVYDITDETNDGSSKHCASLNFIAFMVQYIMHSTRRFKHKPNNECPNENNAGQCTKNFRSEESV